MWENFFANAENFILQIFNKRRCGRGVVGYIYSGFGRGRGEGTRTHIIRKELPHLTTPFIAEFVLYIRQPKFHHVFTYTNKRAFDA